MTPRRKSTAVEHPSSTSGGAPPAPPEPRPAPHVAYIEDDRADPHEHGERRAAPRDDELIGTSGSHGPAPDVHAEEPFGELAPSSSAEGDDA